MGLGKYSPTVTEAYRRDQNWHEKERAITDDPNYDREGYDRYGYNKDEVDRAGYTEHDYNMNEDLYERISNSPLFCPKSLAATKEFSFKRESDSNTVSFCAYINHDGVSFLDEHGYAFKIIAMPWNVWREVNQWIASNGG
jgi:hypothetical protein